MAGTDYTSRGKAGGMRLAGEVGINVTANDVLNPFARQDWGLPPRIREYIEELRTAEE
jgi:hypothetical protein